MNNSQYIKNVTLNGASSSSSPSNVNPGSPGVNMEDKKGNITITLPPGTTPIIKEVSVPNNNTNIKQIHVVITAPNGTVIFDQYSPVGSNTVVGFPTYPLPENCTVTISFETNDGRSAKNVTISMIACYTPGTATTIVSSGTTTPLITTTTPFIIISSKTTGVTTGSGLYIWGLMRVTNSKRTPKQKSE
jgi:hypothetical protein